MTTVSNIDQRDTNQPKNGWLWVHDYSPKLVELNFLVSAITDWFFWHCVLKSQKPRGPRRARCKTRRVIELIDCLNEIYEMEHEEHCLLWHLIWEQGDFPAFELLVEGAAKDRKEISEICSSLFCWSPVVTEERLILEKYAKRIFYLRNHVFNGGNYHDTMTWLEIYDMEINEIYRTWIQNRPNELECEIRRKIGLFKKHAAFIPNKRGHRQWLSEASYLGLDFQQATKYWGSLCEYLTLKTQYHEARICLIEGAIDTRFPQRAIFKGADDLLYDFARAAIDFSETRLRLFWHDCPAQMRLL